MSVQKGLKMNKFNAIFISKSSTGADTVDYRTLSESELMDGDVTIRVSHSTLNYKDGLALSGTSAVVRKHPMIGGIDLAGTVVSSSHPKFKAGEIGRAHV